MDIDDEYRIYSKYHYDLSDETALPFSDIDSRASTTTNKVEERDLLSRADCLVYREYGAEQWKVGDLFLSHC